MRTRRAPPKSLNRAPRPFAETITASIQIILYDDLILASIIRESDTKKETKTGLRLMT